MKKKLFLLALFSSFCGSSQTTIVNGKISKEMPLFKYQYSFVSNELYIAEAFDKTISYATFDKLFVFDEKGNKKKLVVEDKFLLFDISDNGLNYKTLFQESALASPSSAYYLNGKIYKSGKLKKYLNNYAIFNNFFNDQYQFRILDVEGDTEMNYEKDPIYLEKWDYIKQIKKTVSIKKTSLQRLKGDDIYKVKNIGLRADLFDNNSFELITKSVTKDQKSSTLYRTVYDFDGKMINDYSYSYSVPKGNLTRCKTREFNTSISTYSKHYVDGPITDLGINEHFVDPVTGDVFIYGIYTDKTPTGFYVIRFNKTGDKIWEKFYEIQDKKGFNDRTQLWNFTSIYLHKFMNENTLAVSLDGEHDYTDRYNHFFVINKETGELEKKVYMDSYTHTRKGVMDVSLTKYSIFEKTKLAKDRYCEINTLLAYNLNENVKKYIDGLTLKKDIFFDTYITSKGLWLLESDNDDYYKVTLFKD